MSRHSRTHCLNDQVHVKPARPRASLAWIAVLAIVVACRAQTAESDPHAKMSPEQQNEVQADVRAFVERYIATLEQRDETAIRELFVADSRFSWFTDGAQSYSSPEDVLAGMKAYAGIRFQTSLSEIRITPLGEASAHASSNFVTHLTIPGADDYEYGGVITWLLEKRADDSSWQVVVGHTSTPGGPPARSER